MHRDWRNHCESASWDFTQLYDWSLCLQIHGAWELPEIVSVDIDETRNRIVYGFESWAPFADLTALATASGVPCDVVAARVEVRPQAL